jgi:prepilin-type processing-associated H-X9-DG protein
MIFGRCSNVTPRTHHGGRFVNILFADGHAASRANPDGRFTVCRRRWHGRDSCCILKPVLAGEHRTIHSTPDSLVAAVSSGDRFARWRERLQRWATRVDALDAVEPGLEPTLAWLVRLRWAAVIGQAVTVGVVHEWLDFGMPLKVVLALIGLTAVSNALLAWRSRRAAPPATVALRAGVVFRHAHPHRAARLHRRSA